MQRRAPGRQSGFTLAELLIVMFLIAIVSAIAIPAFVSQRETQYEDQIKTALKQAAVAVEQWATEQGSTYTNIDGADGADLEDYGFDMPNWLEYVNVEADVDTFCIEARHVNLTTNSGWRRSTFESQNYVPQPTPDNC